MSEDYLNTATAVIMKSTQTSVGLNLVSNSDMGLSILASSSNE